MPEINRLEQRKRTGKEPDPDLKATTIVSSATRGPVHSLPPELSTSVSGMGTSGRGMSERGTLGRLSPPADSPSSY